MHYQHLSFPSFFKIKLVALLHSSPLSSGVPSIMEYVILCLHVIPMELEDSSGSGLEIHDLNGSDTSRYALHIDWKL